MKWISHTGFFYSVRIACSFFVRIVKMPNSITFILGLSLSDRIESECASVPAFLNACQESGPLIPSLKSSHSVCVWERKMAAFSSVLFLCHLAHPYVFGKISLCNPNYCASPLGINEKNLSSLWKCSLLWRPWWAQLPEPCMPTPWQGFLGVTLHPELLLPWQPLVLQPTRETAFLQELTLRRAVQAEWNHSNSPGLGWLWVHTDCWCAQTCFFDADNHENIVLNPKGENTVGSICFNP